MPNPTIKSRTPFFFSFLLFFLPTSFLVLSLLLFLLACNGLSLGLLCLANSFPHPNPSIYKPPSSNHNILALEEEIPLALNPKFHHTLQLSYNGHHPNPKSIPHRRTNRFRRRRLKLKFLLPNNQSSRFSYQATAFFNSSCHPRFFMTWISALDSLGPRELFSIETVFKSHPSACLLIASDSLDSVKGRNLLKPFSARGFQVAALSPDYAFLFEQTPAAIWFDRLRKGQVQPGEVPIGQNLSNLLRFVLLYKYGGIYIDTDVIVMKSFLPLKNVIGAQTIDVHTGNWSRLNNAVLVFDKNHPLLYSFIEEFSQTFDGNKWGQNGPYLVSRVVSRLTRRPEFDFTVLPPPAFYPVDWSRISSLFHGPRGKTDSKWVSAKLRWMWKESLALHLWNRQSRRLKIEVGSVIGRIMSEHCVFCNTSVSAL